MDERELWKMAGETEVFGLRLNLGRRGEKAVTNRLSYGTPRKASYNLTL
jgi:hypothetical protein